MLFVNINLNEVRLILEMGAILLYLMWCIVHKNGKLGYESNLRDIYVIMVCFRLLNRAG